jgi:hypothetical protein
MDQPPLFPWRHCTGEIIVCGVRQYLRYARRTNHGVGAPWAPRRANSMAFHAGDRSRKSARRLWAKIPDAYRQQATFYTDQYVVLRRRDSRRLAQS